MPLFEYACTRCGYEAEHYVPHSTSDAPGCAACGEPMVKLPPRTRLLSSSVFPFTTTHIDPLGREMTITSMDHLRRVERQYGVVLSAFSNDPSNPDAIKDPPRYRGWDHLPPERNYYGDPDQRPHPARWV